MPVIYQTSMEIPSFAGINQSSDGYNISPRYATEMENVDITGGGFQTYHQGNQISTFLPAAISGLACLHRRYGFAEAEQDILIAFCNTKMYTRQLNNPGGTWTERKSGLTTTIPMSWVCYEVNEINGEPTENPVDVFLFTNSVDGMYCMYGNDLSVVPVNTPEVFGVISRHNERIWGTGIKDKPDSLLYSAPYNPFDWAANEETPEDGGGEIQAPSWDGDSFIGLYPYGSQLLAFKKNAIWKILGTDPGEFVIREQYGTGTIVKDTVAVSGSYAFMLGYDGIVRYDGSMSAGFQQEMVRNFFKGRVNLEKLDQAKAVMVGRTYYMALPIDNSTTNNAILMYNSRENTFSLIKGINVGSFLVVENRLLYTSALYPGYVFEFNKSAVTCLPMKWVGAYQDLGMKNSVKSSFVVYFLPETADTNVDLIVGIQTEKKTKQKTVRIKSGKSMKVALNVSGRYFRLILQTTGFKSLRINGGIKIDMELDPD